MRQIFMTFHKHSLAIFATHVAMSVLIALIITPICLWGIRLGVSLSGGAALTDLDIARFLLSPLGLVVAPVIGALIVTAVMLELAAMLVVMRRGDTLGQTLRFLAGRLPRMLRFAGELILRVSVIVVPFAAVIALVVLPQIKEFDINYYLTFRPTEFTRALLMAAPVALALLGTLIWCLSGWVLGLPLILFTDTPAKACFGKSADMTKGHRLSVCLTLVSWATLMVLVAAAVSFGMRAIIIGLMPPITAGLLVVSLLALVALVLWSLANLLIGAIGVGLLATSIDALFRRVMPLRSMQRPVHGV
ncbi:hypothetical protein HKX54_19365 [Sulfitobacter sp. M57]|uniref:glycerophosphoryl diester phosphodiesterase membrane domain-containing protein n=1 Tax=unclassified Sulfitobacter TaxID=196795 RepID=UPI0023E315F8|nr:MULTISPECIES: glycerophosphoryl diester phosphodiesterase membrane domain-containing protein [unclassified Sulfitobacter]MDF3416639.1 hypothetical protein [Sulfitobacter sp. KE5]MDF3424119.1 hypothetical protein [Sulfitobacter sp. KE43]MDF3435184.1 hypothetical protein [Sulfitobacter sp. KE42]MDF3460812.1 hypothetical protein [Sulfitobacter sp. S74]MDF3464721.1 hypothetical protein [Sulfitobacter sp. Ks18]